jgi:hypothetical protein
MNHDGTRLSCLSHGSIEVKQTGRGGGGEGGNGAAEVAVAMAMPVAVAVAVAVAGYGFLKPQAATTDGSSLGSGQRCLPQSCPRLAGPPKWSLIGGA